MFVVFRTIFMKTRDKAAGLEEQPVQSNEAHDLCLYATLLAD